MIMIEIVIIKFYQRFTVSSTECLQQHNYAAALELAT